MCSCLMFVRTVLPRKWAATAMGRPRKWADWLAVHSLSVDRSSSTPFLSTSTMTDITYCFVHNQINPLFSSSTFNPLHYTINCQQTQTIDEMCSQLIQIAVKVKNFKCDGDEFDGVAGKITDLSSSLRLSHKRMLNNKIARKQQKEPRQQGLLPFFRARGDGS